MSGIRGIGVAVALLTAVVACGKPQQQPSDDGPGTSLTITVTADEGATPKVYTLTCDPVGGNHPEPQAACDLLAQVGADIFEPTPTDQACTQVFGGPQTATVVGNLDGAKIDARFSRQNGCEINRWDTLGTTLFVVPLQ